MTNLTEFRKNTFQQFEYALALGRTVDSLKRSTNNLHGNTLFGTFLFDTFSTANPIDWLEYEQGLNASISGLKQAATKIADLEESVNLTVFEIIEGLKGKHGVTPLNKVFKDLYCDYWSGVTKSEVLPFLKEFAFWLEYVDDELELSQSVRTAKELFNFLDQTLFKQLKSLSDVEQVSGQNWALDVKAFNSIVNGLRKNNKAFVVEWLSSSAMTSHFNAKSHREYKSLYSWLLLSLSAERYGFKSNLWATKKQWQKIGCRIKPDAKSAAVFHYFNIKNEQIIEPDVIEQSSSIGRKISIVYNAEQVVGFNGESYADVKVTKLPVLEQRIKEMNIRIEHSDEVELEAAYHHDGDYITMPSKEQFKDKDSTKAYYATLLHEMVHWTGHESRCKRIFGINQSDPAYAFEELVAEIGSTFLCGRFGLNKMARAKSIQYIEHWLSNLKPDDEIAQLERAAMLANRASNFIYIPSKVSK